MHRVQNLHQAFMTVIWQRRRADAMLRFSHQGTQF